MIKEVAIEPEVMATWQHFRDLWDDLGVSRGRLVAEYPPDWREIVCRKAYDVSSVKAASIAFRLKPPPGSNGVKKWIATNRAYAKGKDWLNNAERHEPPTAFDVIVARANPRNRNRVLVAGDYPTDQAPWKTDTNKEIPRTAADLTNCARLLLSASDELVLVDPNFDAAEARFRDPFAALMQIRPAAKPWRRCELHVAHPLDRGQPDKAVLGNRIDHMNHHLPALIPTGTKLIVFFWLRKPGGKRLHPRFILTELGGLQPDYGLDEGDSNKDTTIISLMSEELWQMTRADYCAASQTFDGGADCVAEIVGTASR